MGLEVSNNQAKVYATVPKPFKVIVSNIKLLSLLQITMVYNDLRGLRGAVRRRKGVTSLLDPRLLSKSPTRRVS